MKIPWDDKYLKISFHVIFTIVVAYILITLVNAVEYSFTNIAIVFGSAASIVGKVFSLFSPLIVAVIIAYLLEPAVEYFQKLFERTYEMNLYPKLRKYKYFETRKIKSERIKFKRRNAGVVLTFATITLIISIFVWVMAAKIGSVSADGQTTSDRVATTIAKTRVDITDMYARMQLQLKEWDILEYTSKYIEDFKTQVLSFLEDSSKVLVNAVTTAGNGIAVFFIGLIMSIYLMLDKERILKRLTDIMDVVSPRKINARIKNFLGDVNAVFSGYIRGQLTDALIMAVLISTLLSFLKVEFALMIGIFSGFSNLIPFFGALMAFILSVTVALFSGEPITALYAAIGILVLQQIDSMVIVPKVVGESVELSPVLVLLSLAVAGSLFGIMGMVFAVPVTAIIKMLFERFISRQREKNLALKKGTHTNSR